MTFPTMSFVFKKIFLITSEFPPLPGGIGNHAFNLANQLSLKGYQVTVCTDQRSENLQDDIKFDNNLSFFVKRIKRYNLVLFTYLIRLFVCFTETREKDTILLSGKFSLWIGAILKFFFLKKKFIGILHGSELFAGNKFQRNFTKWSLRQLDSLIAVSNFTKEMALQLESSLSIEVINNGFSSISSNDNKLKTLVGFPKLVTVGNVTQRKGQQNVIKTLPNLRKVYPKIHYHIVGLPTQKKDFQKLAEELKVSDLITFHGAVSSNQLNSILEGSDIFVMLSQKLLNGDFEGFGIAILEANALGIPSIGSSDSGIADAILDKFSGRLVMPNDVTDISNAVTDIMGNYEQYSSNAKKWSKQFEWDVVIDKYLQLIEK